MPDETSSSSSSSTTINTVTVKLINQSVLDMVETAGNYHPPTSSPAGKPHLTLAERTRYTGSLHGLVSINAATSLPRPTNSYQTPTCWGITGTNQTWTFGLISERFAPPPKGRDLPPMPIREPLRSTEIEFEIVTDDSKTGEDRQQIVRDKEMSKIILEILELYRLPSRDGFGEKGMTKVDLADVWAIIGDFGDHHFVFHHYKNRAVLHDNSLLLESGRELGLPLIAMRWLGGAYGDASLIVPTKTLKSAYERALEAHSARWKANHFPQFATPEEKAVEEKMRCGEPVPQITLFKQNSTFPTWVWEEVKRSKARIVYKAPEDNLFKFDGPPAPEEEEDEEDDEHVSEDESVFSF